jgi:hypothetical protein
MGNKSVSKRKAKSPKSISNDSSSTLQSKNPSVQSLLKDNWVILNRGDADSATKPNQKDRKGIVNITKEK